MQNYVTLNFSDSTLSFSVFGVKEQSRSRKFKILMAGDWRKISDQMFEIMIDSYKSINAETMCLNLLWIGFKAWIQ